MEMRREPYVAVVEAHDEVAARGKLLAEAVGPAEHLSAKPHDEQYGRVGRTAEGLVRDLDAVRRPRELDPGRPTHAFDLFGRWGRGSECWGSWSLPRLARVAPRCCSSMKSMTSRSALGS